jgi:HK97 family phage prohead protease
MNSALQTPVPPSSSIHHPLSGLMVRRELHPKATVPVGVGGPVIDFRSSDQTLDRYQEVITVKGWRLENYRKNPIVQNAHSYCSLADTIGKSLITEVRGDYLFQRIQFAVDENPMAKVAYGLYKGGFLNAVSVGFIPLRWENGSEEKGYRRKYLEQELLEVSAVSIPANPNALTYALKSGAIEKSDLKELADLLLNVESSMLKVERSTSNAQRSTFKEEACPTTEAQFSHLTQQLNEIRAILKRA